MSWGRNFIGKARDVIANTKAEAVRFEDETKKVLASLEGDVEAGYTRAYHHALVAEANLAKAEHDLIEKIGEAFVAGGRDLERLGVHMESSGHIGADGQGFVQITLKTSPQPLPANPDAMPETGAQAAQPEATEAAPEPAPAEPAQDAKGDATAPAEGS